MAEFVVIVLGAASLLLAIQGRWLSVALPVVMTALGLVLYLAGAPAPPGGGDADPMRLMGMGLLIFGGPWLAVVIAIAAWRSRHRTVATRERR